MKVPYMAVVGPAEAEQGKVTVRVQGSEAQKQLSVDEFIATVKEEIAQRRLELSLA
jgi:threonyl-tRNA synthetase